MIRCNDFPNNNCCSSCHEDADYYPLDYPLPFDEQFGVECVLCCRMWEEVQELPEQEFMEIVQKAKEQEK